jgi:hypothetical protein
LIHTHFKSTGVLRCNVRCEVSIRSDKLRAQRRQAWEDKGALQAVLDQEILGKGAQEPTETTQKYRRSWIIIISTSTSIIIIIIKWRMDNIQ